MNLTKSKNGATLTKRIKSAIAMCKRLKWLKLSNNSKYKIRNSNIIPVALYGVETTHVSTTAIDELRTAIADVLGPKSSKRSLDMAFNLSDKNKESDPKAHVLVRRVMELRRMMSKDHDTYVMAQNMVNYYNNLDNSHLFESMHEQETEQQNEWDDITKWKNEVHQHQNEKQPHTLTGPIMLLLHEIMQYNYTLDYKFNKMKQNEPTINIWLMPCQHLKTALHDIVRQKRDIDIAKKPYLFMCVW
jgi:hypothetical protein